MTPAISTIIKAACILSGEDMADIIGPGRSRYYARLRAAIASVAWSYKDAGAYRYSTPSIGRYLGGRDHSTVIHALHHMDVYLKQEPWLGPFIEDLREMAESMNRIEIDKAFAAEKRRKRAEKEEAERKAVQYVIDHDNLTKSMERAVATAKPALKAKNDFSEGERDEAHKFHAKIGKGSDSLLMALQQAAA